MIKKAVSFLLLLVLIITALTSCARSSESTENAEKNFVYGTTSYGASNENAGLNPQDSYMGWSAVRYGVAETLFRLNDSMEIEAWLADNYEIVDDYTITIDLRDDVTFFNGKKMTGESVKACFESLVAEHDRAAEDLAIEEITADGQSITIFSREKVTTLVNYLCDPFTAIIDIEEGIGEDNNVVGTGPYIAESVSATEINLAANQYYWGGKPHVNKITILGFSDSDTLTMAMQSGEIDAAQGLPYESMSLFDDNDSYAISAADTSRVYQVEFNFNSEVVQDINVRKAASMAVDKESFCSVLLNGNGTPASGAFPSNFSYGNDAVNAIEYNLEGAKALLKEAGWSDSDGDGYADKDGETLELTWLTYTSRHELTLLAESVQASLKEIGIKVNVNATDNYHSFLKKGEYDLYAKSFVTATTGDPQYYIITHFAVNSGYNNSHYQSNKVDELISQLRNEFDADERGKRAVEIQQQVLDDCAVLYVSHLKMSLVMKNDVTGLSAHPTDYYEITAELDIQQ